MPSYETDETSHISFLFFFHSEKNNSTENFTRRKLNLELFCCPCYVKKIKKKPKTKQPKPKLYVCCLIGCAVMWHPTLKLRLCQSVAEKTILKSSPGPLATCPVYHTQQRSGGFIPPGFNPATTSHLRSRLRSTNRTSAHFTTWYFIIKQRSRGSGSFSSLINNV